LKELTSVSVWPLLLPVRGKLETILIVPVNWLAAAALGDGAATADGDATGEVAGLAAGLAAAEADGEAAGEAAGAVVGFGAVAAAGAAVG
jgi:hypothetical protein